MVAKIHRANAKCQWCGGKIHTTLEAESLTFDELKRAREATGEEKVELDNSSPIEDADVNKEPDNASYP